MIFRLLCHGLLTQFSFPPILLLLIVKRTDVQSKSQLYCAILYESGVIIIELCVITRENILWINRNLVFGRSY
jgi:hypothetical protein